MNLQVIPVALYFIYVLSFRIMCVYSFSEDIFSAGGVGEWIMELFHGKCHLGYDSLFLQENVDIIIQCCENR